MVVDAADDINSLLSTAGAKLDGNGEELRTSGLSNSIATLNAGKVDKAGLNEALLALGGPDDLVGESADFSYEQPKRMSSLLTGSQRTPWREWRSRHRPSP